jgi:hypothetical protein
MKSALLLLLFATALVGCTNESIIGSSLPVQQANSKLESKIARVQYYTPRNGGKFIWPTYPNFVTGISQSNSHYQNQTSGAVTIMCYPSNLTCFTVSGYEISVNEGGPYHFNPGQGGTAYTVEQGP